ncbi:MAG: PLP-dependent aminotransferase family protein [Bryobacteraceae bacterium]
MLKTIQLDPYSGTPLYRQLCAHLRAAIESGALPHGTRLPATRELAAQLGVNRATISAAYENLESEGLLNGHVGRGTFVICPGAAAPPTASSELASNDLSLAGTQPDSTIRFEVSRPAELLFPLDEFRATVDEVIHSDEASAILQLGSTLGYGPLRRYLLEEARAAGDAGPDDDILITNGCQQAFDLIQRVLASNGETILLEDPVYAGLRNVFQRGGARVIGLPVGKDGLDLGALARAIETYTPRLMVVTSTFQNPTGATMPAQARRELLRLARAAGAVVIENDLYADLRYSGVAVPTIKKLSQVAGSPYAASSGITSGDSGMVSGVRSAGDHATEAGSAHAFETIGQPPDTILLRSFSKIAFPGLRVGWAIGPKHFIARLAEAKQACDLHTDQLSQAVLLRFAQSGRLAAHRAKSLAAGAERLRTTLAACAEFLPEGTTVTRPEGGMNVWVRLPEPLDAGELASRAEREGVSYLPGKYFAVSRVESNALRLSFAGLPPDQIRQGLRILGRIFSAELARLRSKHRGEAASALV